MVLQAIGLSWRPASARSTKAHRLATKAFVVLRAIAANDFVFSGAELEVLGHCIPNLVNIPNTMRAPSRRASGLTETLAGTFSKRLLRLSFNSLSLTELATPAGVSISLPVRLVAILAANAATQNLAGQCL
jgi:hypothetical protein